MNSDRHGQGWDLIPPEKHYNTPKALLDEFNLYATVGLENWELTNLFSPPEGKFEIVTNLSSGKDSLYLVPVAKSYAYLFRGQGAFHNPCLPTLYRQQYSAEEIFINRVRIEEFWLMLQQYPQVKYFIDLGLNVDYVGLAQHYGLKTDVLDLTSSIRVAMFFAMCDYVAETDNYKPKSDTSKTYIGYLYAYPYINDLIPNLEDKNNRKLNVMPIGMQPFQRPGDQRGFAIHLENGKQFTAPVYSFEYTVDDSKEIYEQFKDILVEDELSKRTRQIAIADKLTIDAIKITCARYGYRIFGRKISPARGIEMLKSYGVSVLFGTPSWQLSHDERTAIYNDYKSHGIRKLISSLVQRECMRGNQRRPYIDISYIGEQEMLRLFKKGCPSLTGYDSGVSFLKDGEHVCGIELNYSRQQTIPNIQTGKIDQWNNLPWNEYSLPNMKNRFVGNYPKERLVFCKNDGTIEDYNDDNIIQ